MATGESLVEAGVITPVQLVDGHLPDGLAPGGAVVGVAVALVGHPEKKIRKKHQLKKAESGRLDRDLESVYCKTKTDLTLFQFRMPILGMIGLKRFYFVGRNLNSILMMIYAVTTTLLDVQ